MELEFTTVFKEEPVVITGSDNVARNYVLRELSGKARDSYLTEMGSRMEFSGGEVTGGLSSYDGVQAHLIARCLFDENSKSVPIDTIQSWPTTVLNGLFAKAEELSGLQKSSKSKAKK